MTPDISTFGKNGQGKISRPLLLALNLLPGLIFGGFFLLLSSFFVKQGLTGYLALLVSIPVCLAPVELGIMLFWSARFTGRRSLSRAIAYHRKSSVAEYIGFPLVLFLGVLLVLLAVTPVSEYLVAHLRFWLPVWATQDAIIIGLATSSPMQRSITLGIAVLLSGFVSPLIEEVYNRGFLLPRMEHWGWFAPVINSFLFALQHFYVPENVPGIFVSFIPISYVVMIKKDWRIGFIAHSLCNLWGVFSLIQLIA